jgi:hypothetical protein
VRREVRRWMDSGPPDSFRSPRGGKNPERERLWGADEDPLIAYANNYSLQARCRRPFCDHRRELHLALLLTAFGPGREARRGRRSAAL